MVACLAKQNLLVSIAFVWVPFRLCISVFRFFPRSVRLASYRQSTWWTYNSHSKVNRRVIPSCVVASMRSNYPDAAGNYTSFMDTFNQQNCLCIYLSFKEVHSLSTALQGYRLQFQ